MKNDNLNAADISYKTGINLDLGSKSAYKFNVRSKHCI